MNVSELVARVRDVGSLAIRADTTDQKILDEANSELFSRIVPMFRKMRGGFFRDWDDVVLVDSQAPYAIPTRAVESGVESIKYVDASGNEVFDLKEVNARQIGRNGSNQWIVSGSNVSQLPSLFYFSQSRIFLAPAVSNPTGSLRIYYSRRPGKLVLDTVVGGAHTQVGTILSSSYNGIYTTITLTASHNGWPWNTTVDVMSDLSPFRLMLKDLATGTASMVTDIRVTGADLTSVLVAGQYVTLARKAYVPEIPEEWHEYLLDLTVAKMLNKVGQTKSEMLVREGAAEKLKLLVESTSPRGTNVPKIVRPSW